MEESVKGRLEAYLKYKRISKSEFGRALGVSAAYVGGIRRSIDPEKLKTMRDLYPDLNQDWLLTGSGEMLTDPVSCLSPSSGSVSIPSDVWDVIKKQAFSLEKKDAQMDRCITLLEQSFETLKGAAVHSGVSVAAAGRSDVG